MNLKIVYFLIPFNIFCAYSSYLQFGSTVKFFYTTLLILIPFFFISNFEKKLNKSFLLFLLFYAVYQLIVNKFLLDNFNYLQFSNFIFLIFIFLSFNADKLKTVIVSFAVSISFLIPLAYILKDNNIFGQPAGNTNCLGGLVCVGIIANLYLIYKNEIPKVWLLVSWGLVFISFYFLLELKSRGSFLFLMMSILVMIILNFIKGKQFKLTRKHYFFGFTSFVFLILSAFVIFTQIDLSAYQNIPYRLNLWKAGLEIFSHHPLIGIGEGNLGKVLPYYWDLNTNLLSGAGETEYHLHNEYLNIAVEYGFFSILLFFILILSAFYNGIKFYLFSNNKYSNLILPVIGIFFGICSQIAFDRIFQFPPTALLFAFICGILLSLNENTYQKPFRISRSIFILIAIFHAFFAWPFLYQQILYISTNEGSSIENRKREILISEISKINNSENFKKTILEKLNSFPDSSLKEIGKTNLGQIKKVESIEITAFVNLLMDLEFNWSKNYEAILNSTQYPDFKVMTYFKYSQLLKIELRNEEFILTIFKMNEEFPLMMKTTYLKYDFFMNHQNSQKALDCLLKSAKLTNDPLLKKKILIHQLRFEKKLNMQTIKDCIALRRKIEYDSKFVKKNIGYRFEPLDSYYINFINELFESKEFEKGYDLLIEYLKDDNLKRKPMFEKFILYIQSNFPLIYERIQKDSLLKE